MVSNGRPECSTALIFGMATVKPIRAIMPSTAEPVTAQTTLRGTLRRGSTAFSENVAESSKPTRVNAPRSPASTKEYHAGSWDGAVVLVRIL